MSFETGQLRWGDVQTIAFTPTLAQEGVPVPFATSQLVAANWPVPMSWNVLLFAIGSVNPAEPAPSQFTLNWLFSLGAGQSSSVAIPLVSMGPFNTANNGQLQQHQQLVPSSNLQIQAQLVGTMATTTQSSVYVGAFVAPNNTEPFHERRIERALSGEAGADPQGEKPWLRWMPMGFLGDLDPLKYGPR